MLSAAYQQASDERAECRRVDPENTWLWKMNRRRLDFEATRDALLAVAGRLETTLGGPPVKEISEPAATRRTIYGYIDRLNLPGVFRTFDFPNPDATSPQRSADDGAAAGAVLHEQPAGDRVGKECAGSGGRRIC